MTHAVPLATLRGIAAMAPRRLRRGIKIAIKQIERAFPPVFAVCVEAPSLTPTEVEADRNAAEGRAEPPAPIDTDALHRLVDEVRAKLGVEDTERFRKLLPPR